jgi:putative hydrolase of the HAD superfamily
MRRCESLDGEGSKALNIRPQTGRRKEEKMMKKASKITCAFLDIGGVLLTDGWDHLARRRAAKNFGLQWSEMEDRHHLTFEIFEEGKITLEEYLSLVVFHQKRTFTRNQFRRYMFEQSKAFPDMIELVAQLKQNSGLKIAIVSNEARELNAYRIDKFGLNRLADCFISSCFVHIRKPDLDIYKLALDIAQVRPEHAVFIDNTLMFVQIAEELGMQGVLHTDCDSTRAKLSHLGLNAE